MTDDRPRLEPGPDHPITVRPSDGHLTVRSGSLVVAETDRALVLQESTYPPALYIPLEDVDRSQLTESSEHTYCPYKGEASYFDLADGDGGSLPASVWYYDAPYPAVAGIAGHVAFYPDRVSIDSDTGDR
jgi:uncharacterized protein (DUF427 family)